LSNAPNNLKQHHFGFKIIIKDFLFLKFRITNKIGKIEEWPHLNKRWPIGGVT
jgi:hypothetical protein